MLVRGDVAAASISLLVLIELDLEEASSSGEPSSRLRAIPGSREEVRWLETGEDLVGTPDMATVWSAE